MPSPTHSHAALPEAPAAAAQPAATETRGAGGWRSWKLPPSDVSVNIGTALCFLNVSVAQFRQGTPRSGLFFLMWALVAAVLAYLPLKAQVRWEVMQGGKPQGTCPAVSA